MSTGDSDDDHVSLLLLGKQVFVGHAARPICFAAILSRINSVALLWDLPNHCHHDHDHDVVEAWPRVVRDV